MLRSVSILALVTLLTFPVLGAPFGQEVDEKFSIAKSLISQVISGIVDFVSISIDSEAGTDKPCLGGEINGTMDPYGDECPGLVQVAEDGEEDTGNINGTMDPYG